MNYTEAIKFIEATDWRGSILGLARMERLMGLLGNPEKDLRFIHVAGTNGKGSTCAMIASVLTAAGIKTGLYTSPHIIRYNERFKVDGCDISDEEFCEMAEVVKEAADKMPADDQPTVFEVTTAMAFCWYKYKGCEAVVLEVGLGGRLDATNVIPAPVLAVICNLDLEHTAVLGNTIEEIAFEKGGIIKPGCEVILYGQGEKAQNVIIDICRERDCRLTITAPDKAEPVESSLESQTISYKGRKNIRLSLIGNYQMSNALTAIDAIDALNGLGFEISEEALRSGLANTVWSARFQVIKKDPILLLDGAHNPNGVSELVKCLQTYTPGKRFVFVCGVMADKDYMQMLRMMAPFAERFITVTPDNSRALDSEKLCGIIEAELGIPAESAGGVKDGMRAAMEYYKKNKDVCIFGSLYQAGEVLAFFE